MIDSRIAAILCTSCLLIGLLGGILLTYKQTRQKAVDKQCAYYDTSTGDFTWVKGE